MPSRLIRRLERKLLARPALELLESGFKPSEVSSLLLHVFAQRSRRRSVSELQAQFERTPMLQPTRANVRQLVELESTAFSLAEEFEPIELSPVAPLGLNRVLGGISQNNSLATIRMSEVLADPTTALALECARRRKRTSAVVKLCNRSRQLRLQPVNAPGFTPHFALFSLVSAGRDVGAYRFELSSLREHLRFYLSLLSRLLSSGQDRFVVRVSDFQATRHPDRLARVQAELLPGLSAEFPNARIEIDSERQQGKGYYSGMAVSIDVEHPQGVWNLADGGFTDWTQRLLSNRKERLMVSGLGLERLVALLER